MIGTIAAIQDFILMPLQESGRMRFITRQRQQPDPADMSAYRFG